MGKSIRLILILLAIYLAMAPVGIRAAGIEVSGIGLARVDGHVFVQFDLSWQSSFRTHFEDPRLDNWDAAWVFIKFRVESEGIWRHAWLGNEGHHNAVGSAISVGLKDPTAPFHPDTNPVLGVFLYRDEPGSGTFATDQVRLLWDWQQNYLHASDQVEIRVFAMEMVFVPPGPFALGSGGGEPSAFYRHPFQASSYWVNSESIISMGSSEGSLHFQEAAIESIPSSFPKGYGGFYILKHPVTQGAYTSFLNTLNAAQAANRIGDESTFRHAITGSPGSFTTIFSHLPKNFASWDDAVAFLSWAALRPMTELEFEKAARGPIPAVKKEFVWGNTLVEQATDIINAGEPNESATGGYAAFGNHPGIQGPLRAGSFSAEATGRDEAGTTWWGITDMGGNLWERVVCAGISEGINYTGMHGTGQLDANGNPYGVSNWPTDEGVGLRGGSWMSSSSALRISDRSKASTAHAGREKDIGFRGVRSYPGISTPYEWLIPEVPGTITGTIHPDSGEEGVVYSISPREGEWYIWSVSGSSTIISGQGGYRIIVNAGDGGQETISVIAHNDSGSSEEQIIELIIRPPTPVAQAATDIGCGLFTANWDASNGADGYRLDVSTSSDFSTFMLGYENRDVGDLIAYQVTGMDSETTYYYRIRAYNEGGESGNSSVITTQTLPGLLAGAIETSGETVCYQGEVSLTIGSLTAASGGDGEIQYQWQYSNSGPEAGFFDVNGATEATFKPENGITYTTWYRRLALDGSCEPTGLASEGVWEVSVMPQPGSPLALPAEEITIESIRWHWSSVEGVTGYKWNTSNNFETAIEKGSETLHAETDLNSNTTYTRYVWAYLTDDEKTCPGEPATLTAKTLPCGAYIGQECGGGVVFYIGGPLVLIAAANDHETGSGKWSGDRTDHEGTYTTIGTGYDNTYNGLPTIARVACKDWMENGYEDWFLPSVDELNELWEVRTEGTFNLSTRTRWTSTQHNNDRAYYQAFTNGNKDNASKTGFNAYIRCVRAL